MMGKDGRLWGNLLALGYIPAQGTQHDISHLRDAIYSFVFKKTGRHPELRCNCIVQCRSHCACSGPMRGEILDFAKLGQDLRITDETRKERTDASTC